MRITATKCLLAATLAIVPATLFAAAPPAKAPAKATTSHPTKPAMADHATTGVVKSVNATGLTITRSGKEAGEMSFVLNSSTKRDGKIEVGAPVSVRYRENGASHVATAISAQHAKPQSTSKKP
ncbi:MAG TPA: hypothetical protein VHR17_15295 [Thermoanaerobaculia bacterium]|nr:hypothetical protein [Thermoanaerobaculia bacterium]